MVLPGSLFLHFSSVVPTQLGGREVKEPEGLGDAVDVSGVTGAPGQFGDEWVGFRVRLWAEDLLLRGY